MDSQIIELNFLDQKIPLRSEGEDDSVQQIVDLAELKIKDAERRANGAAPHKVALLALLDLAEDYVKSKARAADYKKEMFDKSENLIKILDSELQ